MVHIVPTSAIQASPIQAAGVLSTIGGVSMRAVSSAVWSLIVGQ
jgi:hypothetical protein